MKSDEVRVQWRQVLDHVRSGGAVVVERYGEPIARITPYSEREDVSADESKKGN